MFRILFTVARDVLALLLYIDQVSLTLDLSLSIVTFDEPNSVWSAVKLFPARSKAVILNNTSPSVLF